jgi:two-component system sensor kinase
LEAANREMEAFSYSVSHDLKAPIRAIDGFSRMLMTEHAAQLDPEALRLLEVVRHNTGHMAQLIEDLLALSRLGRRAIRKTRLDLAAMCAVTFNEIKQEDPGRRVELILKDQPSAYGDPSLMRQVLLNLLTNAFKFTKPREDAAIEVGGWGADGENIYYVKDNGVGFDMRYQDKLFGVFQRLHGQGDFEGTGVGLAIVQRILLRHGGRIWAEGKLGEGATFYFAMPNWGNEP